jgi:tRNA wybutosine-synthesizing protein 3
MVAVRSTGLAFDTVIGYENREEIITSIVTEDYLNLMVDVANERFKVNSERISRFRAALLSSYAPSMKAEDNGFPEKVVWEDKAARQARKREEGLARQRILKSAKQEGGEVDLELEQSDAR